MVTAANGDPSLQNRAIFKPKIRHTISLRSNIVSKRKFALRLEKGNLFPTTEIRSFPAIPEPAQQCNEKSLANGDARIWCTQPGSPGKKRSSRSIVHLFVFHHRRKLDSKWIVGPRGVFEPGRRPYVNGATFWDGEVGPFFTGRRETLGMSNILEVIFNLVCPAMAFFGTSAMSAF